MLLFSPYIDLVAAAEEDLLTDEYKESRKMEALLLHTLRY